MAVMPTTMQSHVPSLPAGWSVALSACAHFFCFSSCPAVRLNQLLPPNFYIMNLKCRTDGVVYLDDLLQVSDVDGLRFDDLHDDSVHVREIVAASIFRIFLLGCFRTGRAGTAHAAVTRVARVP